MLPPEFLKKMEALLGEEYPAFLSAYQAPRNAALRWNCAKGPLPEHFPFSLQPVPWAKDGYYYDPSVRPGLHPYHEAGAYYLQEASAMSAAQLLDAKPGECVLDLCAAPGGKATQIAAAMQGKGLLVCNEYHAGRAKVLAGNIERMGVANALVLNESPQKLASVFDHCFDRILVDAPCSGEGMFRKEEAAVSSWSQSLVEMCAARQSEILCAAASMLKSGGRLVYSTCTFSPEENEGVISRFLQAHPAFAVEALEHPFFSPGRPDWVDADASLSNTFRLWPHKCKGEGHFVAVLRAGELDDGIYLQESPAELPKTYTEFAERYLTQRPQGMPVRFGDTLFLAPPALPCLRGLRVLRAGLELGQEHKGYFQPSHALALWLHEASATVHYTADSAEIRDFLQGKTLPANGAGWVLVCVDSFPLGWGKASGGILKNHYPKGLRRPLE